jgi:hypothetical protein
MIGRAARLKMKLAAARLHKTHLWRGDAAFSWISRMNAIMAFFPKQTVKTAEFDATHV